MLDLLATARAIRDACRAVPGINEAILGLSENSFPDTPAVEIIANGFDLQHHFAGAGESGTIAGFQAVVYVPHTGNLEQAEEEILPAVQNIVEALEAAAQDPNSAVRALVCDLKVKQGSFGMTAIGNQPYRICPIQITVETETS